jgi:hypothetical protein
MTKEATKLPATNSEFRKNLQAAASAEVIIRTGGLPWMDIDSATGAMTLGANRDALPDHDYVIDVRTFEYGFLEWQGRRAIKEVMVPIIKGSRPIPPGGQYAEYPTDGPAEVWRFTANSLDEPGLAFVFSAKNVSNILRCKRLLGAIAAQDAVAPEFINPVCRFYPVDKWTWRDGSTIHCVGIHVIDWMSADGVTGQSGAGLIADQGEPWDAAAAE